MNRLCKLEAVEKSVILPVCRADERIAKYCGASVTPAIKKSKDRNKESPLHSAGKKKTRNPDRNVIIDDFDMCVVKRTFMLEKILPNCITILSMITQKINLLWGQKSLRKILHKIGFRWRK
jgi:hypothetical protein